MSQRIPLRCLLAASLALLVAANPSWGADAPSAPAKKSLRGLLDAPLLFTKRHSYTGIHIYDTYYKWPPGGGGIYICENPSAPAAEWRIRPVIDPTTPGTLGVGVYTHPELSWDAKRLLFCFKGEPNGSTSIYEIGVDGTGLRRVTDPSSTCASYKGSMGGMHDIAPCYLPDGRILFTSTRPAGLVPCFNSGVNILHVMNADGSDIHPISVNNVNEFDPCVMPDGRILHGRWEYVDKNALTQQSLWTIFPDGTNETALFANNMVHPEATLDARPVPDAPHLIASTFAPHNSTPTGTVAIINTHVSKNSPDAIYNFETPNDPTNDRGLSCEPWPISRDVLLYSGRPPGAKRNALMMIDREGNREVIYSDPDICCFTPMLVKPRPVPPVLASSKEREKAAGRFLVLDVYQGLAEHGVRRGEVKQLRVIEETSRVSPTPGGAMNQVFLMSGVLAWSSKIFHGVVPVEPDGSACFEAPSGRALYLQALDADGRLVQSMRTFVQAVPGVTRSCIGCHEHKYSTPIISSEILALKREPSKLQPESWGTGYVDYPSMVQPIFNRHCVSCHGGEKGFEGRLDLTGGWTEYFTNSYENLISRRETQVMAHLIAGIDCMNGTALFSVPIRPPRFHGSGAAPLAQELVGRHKEQGRIPNLTRTERDLIMAWIDTNGLFHGTWDYTTHGCSVKAWNGVQKALQAEMSAAGCNKCHTYFDGDWFNLERPEFSRILRAPLAAGKEGYGTAMCRNWKVDPTRQRIFVLRTGYAHGVTPVENFKAPPPAPVPEDDGKPVISFASTEDKHYQAMLAIIQNGRRAALAAPRADMPGAKLLPGMHRQFLYPPLPDPLPELKATVDADCIVHLSWERSARTIGLTAELHRGKTPDFEATKDTLLAETALFQHDDPAAEPGPQHYALFLSNPERQSKAIRTTITVPAPPPPPAPAGLKATPAPGRVDLTWQEVGRARYNVYRAKAGAAEFQRLTAEPTTELRYSDTTAPDGVQHAYVVRAVSARGAESDASATATAAPLAETKEPLFVAAFAENADAALFGGGTAKGTLHGGAKVANGALDVSGGGYATFDHRPEFDLGQRLTVELWVNMAAAGQMPIPVSCGHWNQAGWFLQRIGGHWRWHVGGIDCDGGRPEPGKWLHVVGTYDGQTARLYQDGRLIAEKAGAAILAKWSGPLHVGQYSAEPGAAFQVTGQIRGLKVYSRAMPPHDVAAAFKAAEPATTKP
ncbi:MAG TPA: hypothetical protein PLE19_00230 [Planctomycetota bacterium]|nr:hypothetical protein [Planctomycetota bacterium]HRR79449.1 hypothetical protein [Planctomycetota bacterium]HRT94511.1 hypothetical protein [Planctomycetota bacterium]